MILEFIDDNTLMYQRWLCKNRSTITIASFIGADISVAGGNIYSDFLINIMKLNRPCQV